jgi:hypothetical protein
MRRQADRLVERFESFAVATQSDQFAAQADKSQAPRVDLIAFVNVINRFKQRYVRLPILLATGVRSH